VILSVSAGAPLRGKAFLPGDKSISHRAALFAALAEGESCFENYQVSGVTRAMLGGLDTLGIGLDLEGTRLRVSGEGLHGLAGLADLSGGRQSQEAPLIDCGNSATTMRLLAGGLSAAGAAAVLDGSPGLRRRPMQRIVEPLRQMGVPIEASQGCAPLILKAAKFPLNAIDFTLPVASAQVKSCLLLAALAAASESRLREPGPSRDHSERMLRKMGVSIESSTGETQAGYFYETTLEPPRGGRLKPLQMTIPGDFSAAAFLIVAALITPGSEIHLEGVGLNPTRTGLLEALQAMGGDIQTANLHESGGEPLGDLTIRYSQMQGIQVSGPLVVRMIDEFPAFAIAAAYADGTTIVRDAEELRYKESDRISALCLELSQLGVRVEEFKDGFMVRGGKPVEGGEVHSRGDHRLAMALALAGLGAKAPVRVQNAEVVAESFPDFIEQLAVLGARLDEV
jgi:3-phosphoshikimate 1-carboxyvinyltransferase